MGKCKLILNSTFRPPYERYNIINAYVRVWCDGDPLTDLMVDEIQKLTIDSGSHLFQFEAYFCYSCGGLDEDIKEYLTEDMIESLEEDKTEYKVTFRSKKVVDLPIEQQFVLLEEDTMMQLEQWIKDDDEFHQCIKNTCEELGHAIKKFYDETYNE